MDAFEMLMHMKKRWAKI